VPKLSRDRAQSVADALNRYGISVARVEGFGQDMPVDDNQTEDGRRRNRRVEVWVQ
jgi:phosphate transport system substrate-binding protein